MTEFWELNFRDKQEMWGAEPADFAVTAFELFKRNKLSKILIPGFGYGRNARIFVDNGFTVTGIEISETAILLARKNFGDSVKIFHGSVTSMPFDNELYDGVFCYSLIHLLEKTERVKLIDDCYRQLKSGGLMVFAAISKKDAKYGEGKEIYTDTFETKHGVSLFFYDHDSIKKEFGSYGLIEPEEINEPQKNMADRPSQMLWKIVCKK